ncbi:putative DNA ligase [Lelliottia phage phD2B]|uniref:Putative DNA ligase n=1 Tax=Lelliottia phage phD2B TaxID=1542498 RepID=A0A088FSB6_9CAUD|nr:putative DNA ligase [Lelliottia phage phD2B]AIM51251.1 putative DNA ligase [Lelliottia phage phD2B]
MNIFQFFGLDEDHRRHPVQLVKHRDEVPEKKLTFPCYAQVKRDGIFAAVCVQTGGLVRIFGRTGKKLANVEHLEDRYACFPAGIYFGELQSMAVDIYLEALSGVVNPNRTEPLDFVGQQIKDALYIDFFDMMTLQGFIAGQSDVTFVKRHAALNRRIAPMLYAEKHDAILPLIPCHNEKEVQAFADEQTDAGREGAVFKLDCDWEAGHKGYRQTKIVRMVSYDLTCIGFEEGKGKYAGKVANLVFKWKGGKSIKVMLGKGWTHAQAEKMFNDIKFGGELNVIGKIFAVKALQESSKGVLRLPKAGELRHDKEVSDVY